MDFGSGFQLDFRLTIYVLHSKHDRKTKLLVLLLDLFENGAKLYPLVRAHVKQEFSVVIEV